MYKLLKYNQLNKQITIYSKYVTQTCSSEPQLGRVGGKPEILRKSGDPSFGGKPATGIPLLPLPLLRRFSRLSYTRGFP